MLDSVIERFIDKELPITLNQERRLLAEALIYLRHSQRPLFHAAVAFDFNGRVSISSLTKSLNQILERHLGLRSVYFAKLRTASVANETRRGHFESPWPLGNGRYRQVVRDSCTLSLDVTSLEGIEDARQNTTIKLIMEKEYSRPFDYQEPPLLRAHLFKCHATQHILFLVLHHLIFDMWSVRILQRELAAFYKAGSAGNIPHLSPIAIHFPDFAVWQREMLRCGAFRDSFLYWRGVWPTVEKGLIWYRDFPADLRISEDIGEDLGTESISLDAHTCEQISKVVREVGITQYVFVLSAFFVLLHRCTYKPTISLWVNFANRTSRETETFIGWTTNSHLISAQISAHARVHALFKQVQSTILTALLHQEVPTAAVMSNIGAPRFTDLNITFDGGSAADSPDFGQALTVKQSQLPFVPGRGWLSGLFVRFEIRSAFDLTIIYSKNRFSSNSVSRMLQQLNAILAVSASDPEIPIARLLTADSEIPPPCNP